MVDDCALQVEGQLRLLLALRRRLYGYGLAFVEDTREGRTAVGLLFGELRRLTTLTTCEEGRATGEAIDVDLSLGSEAVTDEDPPSLRSRGRRADSRCRGELYGMPRRVGSKKLLPCSVRRVI